VKMVQLERLKGINSLVRLPLRAEAPEFPAYQVIL
jgi:hypothetical protein